MVRLIRLNIMVDFFIKSYYSYFTFSLDLVLERQKLKI